MRSEGCERISVMGSDIEDQLHTLLAGLVATRPKRAITASPPTRSRLRAGPRVWWTVVATVATAVIVALALTTMAPLFGHRERQPTAGATSFSNLFYPPPHKPTGPGSVPFVAGATFMCPSLGGVLKPSARPQAEILATFNELETAATTHAALLRADRAAWPVVRSDRSSTSAPGREYAPSTVDLTPAIGSPHAGPFVSLCGRALITDSWALGTCGAAMPIGRCTIEHPALEETYFFLDRRGRWLLWAQYP